MNETVYVPIVCGKCGEEYLVMRVRFGTQVQVGDFFASANWLTFWRRLFLSVVNHKTGEVTCPKCKTTLMLNDIIPKAVAALAKQSYMDWKPQSFGNMTPIFDTISKEKK